MYRELIISIIIIVLIFSLEYVTQKSSENYLIDTINNINEIKDEISKESIDNEIIKQKTSEKYEKWTESYKILAYYIEHNELEKIQTSFVEGKSFIEVQEYKNAYVELEKTVFLLEHLKEKYLLKLKNIF